MVLRGWVAGEGSRYRFFGEPGSGILEMIVPDQGIRSQEESR